MQYSFVKVGELKALVKCSKRTRQNVCYHQDFLMKLVFFFFIIYVLGDFESISENVSNFWLKHANFIQFKSNTSERMHLQTVVLLKIWTKVNPCFRHYIGKNSFFCWWRPWFHVVLLDYKWKSKKCCAFYLVFLR